MVAAGSFDRRITIREPVDAGPGSAGEPLIMWQDVFTSIPASKVDVSSTEQMRNPQIRAEMDAIWRTRWLNKPINTTMQIVDDLGIRYEIRGISPLPGRRAGYDFTARNLDATGATA